jgi:hypothetical protein
VAEARGLDQRDVAEAFRSGELGPETGSFQVWVDFTADFMGISATKTGRMGIENRISGFSPQ